MQRLSPRVWNDLQKVFMFNPVFGLPCRFSLIETRRGQWSEDILAKWLTVVLMYLINHYEFTKTRSSLAHIVEPPCWLLHQVYLLPLNPASISPQRLNTFLNSSIGIKTVRASPYLVFHELQLSHLSLRLPTMARYKLMQWPSILTKEPFLLQHCILHKQRRS